MAIVPQVPQHGTTAPTPGRTVADLLDAYEKDYLPLKAPNSQYQEALLFRWFRSEFGAIPLRDLSPLILRTWRDSLRTVYQPASVRRYMTVLSAVLTAGVEQYEWLSSHPLRKVAKPPAPPDRERCLTADEQTRLLAECQVSRNRHLYVLVVLALSTGTRKQELLQRQWRDVDLERGLLSIPQSKNKERRAIPLVPQALDLLRTHARHPLSPWCFPRADGKKPVYVHYAWAYACQRAGLVDFHWHDMRHTAASYLAMSGASLREIAEILGHRSVRQTMKYAHLVEPHTRSVLQTMAAKFLDAPPPPPVTPPPPMAPDPGAAQEHQVLVAVRALEPLAATAVQVAQRLHLPSAYVGVLLETLADAGTLVRVSKTCYRYRADGPGQLQEGGRHEQ
jgi:integrase